MKTYRIKDVRRYIIQDAISGTEIERAHTLDEAKRIIAEYIADDIKNGTANDEMDGRSFKNDFDNNGNCFYEIKDNKTDEIIEILQNEI